MGMGGPIAEVLSDMLGGGSSPAETLEPSPLASAPCRRMWRTGVPSQTPSQGKHCLGNSLSFLMVMH